MKQIQFYFDFASPYGYLASTQIEALADRHGWAVRWFPILLGAAFSVTGAKANMTIPVKGEYSKRDVVRTAKRFAVPIALPPNAPIVSLLATRAFHWLNRDDEAMAVSFAKAAYHAHWGEGRDITKKQEIARIAGTLSLDGATLLAGAAQPDIKQVLKRLNQDALDKGVFGSPFMLIDGEPFWGVDKLSEIDGWLEMRG